MSIHYTFPRITNVSDVLKHIDGNDAFGVTKRDDATCVQYNFSSPSLFPPVTDEGSAILRECRGIKFCPRTGEIRARTMQKFFNHGERSDADPDMVQRFRVLEKLDGSMVHPCLVPDGEGSKVVWMTKRGATDVAAQVEKFLDTHLNYVQFANNFTKYGLTPSFEWCSNQNRIVLDYPVDRLVLLAIRENVSGAYMPFEDMRQICEDWDIECVKVVMDSVHNSLQELADTVKMFEGEEGVVVRWDDGHMMKMKGDWYVLRHRAKEGVTKIRSLVEIIFKGELDDIIPLLSKEDKVFVTNFSSKIWVELASFSANVQDIRNHILSNSLSKKQFALNVPASKTQRSVVFALWDADRGAEVVLQRLIDFVIANCNTNNQFEKLAEIIPSAIEHMKKRITIDG